MWAGVQISEVLESKDLIPSEEYNIAFCNSLCPPGQPEVTEIFEEVGSSLTCTSTGGPASLVTWQREGVEITSGQRVTLVLKGTCSNTVIVVYMGNLWFVRPIDSNVKHHILQSSLHYAHCNLLITSCTIIGKNMWRENGRKAYISIYSHYCFILVYNFLH